MIQATHHRSVLVDYFDAYRSLTKASLFECLREVWPIVIHEKPVWNWHIEYLCNELQEVYERVFANKDKEYDLLINIPPGTTKSTIVSVVAPMWAWSRMPTLRTIVSTHAYDLGLDLSRKAREIVLDATFSQAHHMELKTDLNTKGHFGNVYGGERQVATVAGKNPMGKHAHVLIVDDPIDPEKAFSVPEMGAANRYLINTLPSRMVSKTLTPLILVMQRLHQNDPTAHLIKAMQRSGQPYRHICLPAVLTNDVHPPTLRSRYRDGLLDPVRLPMHVLKIIELTGTYAYASQYLQTPVPPGGGMFKVEKIQIVDELPDLAKQVRFWDKAATQDGGCRTAGAKLGLRKDGGLCITNMRTFQKDSDRREQAIRDTATVDGVAVRIGMEQEPGSAGVDSVNASIKALAGYIVTAERPTGDKALRADPFSAQVNAGNVTMMRGPWNDLLIEEMRFFPKSQFKDQVDALSGAFKLLCGPSKVARAV